MCYSLLIAINFLCQLVMWNIRFVSRLCECVGLSHSGKRGSVVGLMVGQICMCVYVCVSVGVDWGWEAEVELMDKVSWAIRQKHHNQAVSSMPPSPCSLPLFDKHRNRITIWTGPGATGKDCPTFQPTPNTHHTAKQLKETPSPNSYTHTTGSMCVWVRFCSLCGDQVSPQGY